MKPVAVITPYFRESIDILQQNHQSVISQSYPTRHVFVADGEPNLSLDSWDVDHVILPRSHHDIGSTPRLIGCFHAIGLGYEAVAFLDADNWYHIDHINTVMQLREQHGADIVSSGRMLCRLDGSEMAICQQTDPQRFIDTNCMLLGRSAFHLLHHWVLMPSYGHVIGDKIFWYYVRTSGVRIIHSDAPTVYYRCQREGIYRLLGEPLPAGVKPVPDYASGFQQWAADGYPPFM